MKEEQILQIQIIEYLSLVAKKNNIVFFSVPNEAFLFSSSKQNKRSYAKLMILKKMGLTSGVSDLIIIKKSITYCLECKSKKGRLSKNQKIFLEMAEKAGAITEVVDSFEKAMIFFNVIGIKG
jgi:hypothetical protein